MPTFPQYEGEVPQCLNLFNLRHYWLIIYWVYFRPTALKYYLYRADSQIYRAKPGMTNLLATWKIPQYRYLYLIFPLASLFFAILLGLIFSFFYSWINNSSISWKIWLQVIIITVIVAICFFLIFWIGFGHTLSISRGVVGGVISAVTTIFPICLVIGTFLGLSGIEKIQISQFSVIFALFFGASIGLAISIPIGIVLTGFIGGIVGLLTGFASGILGAVAYGLLNIIPNNEFRELQIIIIFTICLGLASSAAYGVALSIARCSMTVSILSLAVATAIGIEFDSLKNGLLAWLILYLGSLRIHFYLLGLTAIFVYPLVKLPHPIQWSELTLFPLPGTYKVLTYNLAKDEAKGLRLLINLAANPFQRWQAQRVLKTYLEQHSSPLKFLYRLILSPVANSYVYVPFTDEGWEKIPAVKKLLLGEISNQWVDCTFDAISRFVEKLIYKITKKLRDSSVTPLVEYARFLYQLEYRNITSRSGFQLADYRAVYSNTQHYVGGEKINQTFETMVIFLSCHELSDFLEVTETANSLTLETAIYPEVIKILISLQEISRDILNYLISRVWSHKQSAILRAKTKLEFLEKDITRETILPEYKILELIVKQWNDLILPESEKVGNRELTGTIINPYIAGNPVRKESFIGREDIMRTLKEIWNKPGQCPSVVLYGHRRMGKSSILQNLQFHLDRENTLFIDCNMHLMGSIDRTGQLLYLFALEIYYEFTDRIETSLQKLDESDFMASPYQAFRRFLDLLNQVRDGKRFIIAIDEFEEIEELLEKGKLDAQFLKFWRAIFQTYHWLIVAFAGLYTLQEMTTDYWNPLFSSVQLIPVSFLTPDEARQLIQNPIPIEYTPEAVENIIYLTNGQPYLIQLIGKALVTYYNDRIYQPDRFYKDIKFTIAEVQNIVNSDKLFLEGNGYFQGVWNQAKNSHPEGQLEVLKQLCDRPFSIEELVSQTNFSTQQVEECLKTLIKHDVIKHKNNCYEYTVELMRRWVLQSEFQQDRSGF